MKIVINENFGGLDLSEAVYKELGINGDNKYGDLKNRDSE